MSLTRSFDIVHTPPQSAFPLFLKLEDLQAVWKKGFDAMGEEERKAAGGLVVQVTTVDDAVRSITAGEERTEKLIFLTSEAF